MFICKTSHCPNFRAIKQIPFGLWLFIVSPSGEKIVLRKQHQKNFPSSQTNATHKHSQLGSRITEPISAWKVYFCLPPGEIYANLQSTLSVSHCAQSEEKFFGCSIFFLKLLEQNGEGNKGNDRYKANTSG